MCTCGDKGPTNGMHQAWRGRRDVERCGCQAPTPQLLCTSAAKECQKSCDHHHGGEAKPPGAGTRRNKRRLPPKASLATDLAGRIGWLALARAQSCHEVVHPLAKVAPLTNLSSPARQKPKPVLGLVLEEGGSRGSRTPNRGVGKVVTPLPRQPRPRGGCRAVAHRTWHGPQGEPAHGEVPTSESGRTQLGSSLLAEVLVFCE